MSNRLKDIRWRPIIAAALEVSALHLAAASGDVQTFRELINNKANPHFVTEEGETVLDYLPRDVLQEL